MSLFIIIFFFAQLYASLKLIPRSKVAVYVDKMIARLGLTEFADRCAGGYSGGNKRKLSVGISLIAGPSVLVAYLILA
jgi:ABC-type multidrug transport system ATPase subunit